MARGVRQDRERLIRELGLSDAQPANPKSCTECGGSGDGPDRMVNGCDDVTQDPCPHCRGTGAEPPTGETGGGT